MEAVTTTDLSFYLEHRRPLAHLHDLKQEFDIWMQGTGLNVERVETELKKKAKLTPSESVENRSM